MNRLNTRTRFYLGAILVGLTIVASPQFRDLLSKMHKHEGHLRRYAQGLDDRIIGKYGFVNKNGVQVAPPTLDEATNFSQGFAAVKTAEHWNIMDKSGRMMLKPRVGAIMQVLPCAFADGLTPMKLDNKWGFVNRAGDWVVKPEFDQVEPFDHGLARVCKDYDGWGFIDTTGKAVVPLQFTNISLFHGELAVAENEDGVGLIGRDGAWKVKPRYKLDFVSESESDGEGVYGDGVFVMARANEYAKSGDPVTYDWFDTNGKLLSTLTCDQMQQFADGCAVFEKDGRWGFLNKRGTVVVKPTFEEAQPFEYGLGAAQTDDNEWQYFNAAGKRVVRPSSDPMGAIAIPEFSEGLAAMRIDNHWGFVNSRGDIVIEPRFDEVGDFHDGMAWTMMENSSAEH